MTTPPETPGSVVTQSDNRRLDGSARPKPAVRRRNRLVGVRLTEAEYATIARGAEVCEMSLPEFLRRAALPGGDGLLLRAAVDEETSSVA